MKHINVLSVLLIMVLQAGGHPTGLPLQDKDGDQLLPGENIIIDGVPKVPKELGKIYDGVGCTSYSELLGWGADKIEMRVLRFDETSPAIYAISGPEEEAGKLFVISPKEGAVYSYYFDRQGKNLVYNVDVDGNEQYSFISMILLPKRVRGLRTVSHVMSNPSGPIVENMSYGEQLLKVGQGWSFTSAIHHIQKN
jgi:hypothetical protein